MATAIGGRIRCEISQNAMSLLPSARRNRRPMVWARSTKTPTAAAIGDRHGRADGGGDERERDAADADSPISPSFGRYVKRTSA